MRNSFFEMFLFHLLSNIDIVNIPIQGVVILPSQSRKGRFKYFKGTARNPREGEQMFNTLLPVNRSHQKRDHWKLISALKKVA